MDILVLILLTLNGSDVYSKVVQMPEHSTKKDCLEAGVQWMATQKPADSPQYLCAEKSSTQNMDADGAPLEPPKPKVSL